MQGCGGPDQPGVDAEHGGLDTEPPYESETSELGQCGSYRIEQHRAELPQQAPRALSTKTSTQWLRSMERWLNPRDRVLALLPFYAGLRLGETAP